MNSKKFQKTIWDFYKENKRNFPWRETTDPYKILISEVMLQQTQTFRVLPKYKEFITKFPNLPTLAKSPLSEILKVWSGLGYNRRALYLHKAAQKVVQEFDGKLPLDPKTLQTFPGIGPNTAGAVYIFSTNKPCVFIETNIRRVFIHHFFNNLTIEQFNNEKVHDNQLFPLIEQTLDKTRPRDWYYALMDYGAYLGKHPPAGGSNPNRKSKHYLRQSKFEGSLRQTRGKILKILLEQNSVQISELEKLISGNHLQAALRQLEKEGFIEYKRNRIQLKF